jgi:hypothetical protein
VRMDRECVRPEAVGLGFPILMSYPISLGAAGGRIEWGVPHLTSSPNEPGVGGSSTMDVCHGKAMTDRGDAHDLAQRIRD